MCTSPHAVHLVHAGCCNTRAPARCSLQGVAARPGWCCGLPAGLPLPVRLTRSRPTVSGGARMLGVARAPSAARRRSAGAWAWPWGRVSHRVSMFTISGYSCTTYRAAFSSYTYLTERIEYEFFNTVTSLAMKVCKVGNSDQHTAVIRRYIDQPRARQISRLARGGAPAGAGRMVVERINKTELRTAVCGELEGLGGARRSGCPASQKSDLTMWEVRCDE